MSSLGERVRDARVEKGLSQQQLAEAVGYQQVSISEIERGESASPRSWRKLAEVLDIPEDEFRRLMLEARRDSGKTTRLPPAIKNLTPTPNAMIGGPVERSIPNAIPVYGRAQGGPDGKYDFNGEIIGWEPAPPQLAGVPGVYAVYIDGESMYPRYKPGETVVAQPGRPVTRGDDVVVQLHGEDPDSPPFGFVKEFVRYTSTKLVVSQFNPVKEIEFDRSEVVSVHRIMHAAR